MEPKLGRFQAVLAVVKVGATAWRFGYSPARHMWRVAPDVSKAHGDLSSSAVNKLDEALQTCAFKGGALDVSSTPPQCRLLQYFDLVAHINRPSASCAQSVSRAACASLQLVPPEHGASPVQGAIDLGAAPGAWTELLAQRARRVVAVDPAELSDQCKALPNVRHVQASSSETESITTALEGHKVEVVVCDMNQSPQFCAGCIGPLLPLLAPGGWIVMTCKMYGMGRDRCGTSPLAMGASHGNPN